MPHESALVTRARKLAQSAHRHQKRKASGAPYFTHLEAVACLLERHGYVDDTVLAAAYLHDLLEDQPHASDELRRSMPAEVVEVVEVLTERKLDIRGNKRPKAARFADYVKGLNKRTAAVERAIPISCADRIHNTLSIVADEQRGLSPFMQLATRPGELKQQLSTLRRVYAPIVTSELLETFDEACRDLAAVIERWLPGRAALIAAEAHLGQFDKGGQPYILHPMRLALNARSPEAGMVAFLHDVVEDSRCTLEELTREGFPAAVLRAVDHLTRQPDELYSEFIERVSRDRLATHVKLLDLADNCDLSRLSEVSGRDRRRVEQYQRAIRRLEEELQKRSLYVVLDANSRAELRAQATLPFVKAEHVTLAYRVKPQDFEASWVPGEHPVGSQVELNAVGLVRTPDIEVVVVQMAGQTTRPHDGKTLHITLSRAEGARSREANQALLSAPTQPFTLTLHGRLCWVNE